VLNNNKVLRSLYFQKRWFEVKHFIHYVFKFAKLENLDLTQQI